MKNPEDFHILIVDDEEGIRRVLSQHFEIDGYTIFTASGGNEALEIVKHHKIDFVITDIRMPNGDGETLLEKIREIDPNIPVVVMITGFAELTREEAIRKGALDLLLKPVDLGVIEKYIEENF